MKTVNTEVRTVSKHHNVLVEIPLPTISHFHLPMEQILALYLIMLDKKKIGFTKTLIPHMITTRQLIMIEVVNTIYYLYHSVAMSPNHERLKNLCNKLSNLGSDIEEGKLVKKDRMDR